MAEMIMPHKRLPVQKEDAIMALSSQPVAAPEDTLSNMCNRLLESFAKRKTIRERTLLDFSKLVVWVISDPSEQLPQAFDRLTEYASDYWKYQVKTETDSERAFSYVRVYQITSMVKTFQVEQEREKLILLEMERNQPNKELLHRIYLSPGITCRDLGRTLKLSPAELEQRTKYLEEKRFLSSRRSKGDKYYLLTKAGTDLYHNLIGRKTCRILSDRLSAERTFVFYTLLELLYKRGFDSVPAKTLLQKVSRCSDSAIHAILKALAYCDYSSPHRNETEFRLSGKKSYTNDAPLSVEAYTGSSASQFSLIVKYFNTKTSESRKEPYPIAQEKVSVRNEVNLDD